MSLFTFLRRATDEDCPRIYHIHQDCIHHICNTSYNTTICDAWTAQLSPSVYLKPIHQPDYELWVIECQGKIEGFFQLHLTESQLDALYVHSFIHQQGLGTALLQRAENITRQANLSFIKIYASPNASSFYSLNNYQFLARAELPLNEHISTECELMYKYL